MRNVPAKQILAYALVGFFIIGAIGNILAPKTITEEYARWGYPDWFHFVTGSLELTSAILMARQASRTIGSLLAACIMASAIVTVIFHGEYTHAIAPAVVLGCLVLSVYLHRK
ncbi:MULTISPECIES: DoxX family protein [Komagataeibacter]|uniref:DoxX family protein n=1 Tax=Komagataeibacter oboediens TaxID=65958 RepID=A0ABS5SS87_9PROT|nr:MULTISPECIES: DoxX family protein [Komagataeibacter]MBE7731333.1 DoxX family protein [Komagataeibacter sp. FXV3]MBT0677103.1 DoxX family protein [Komagataeibacter oboediens]MBT0680431.1 DoxX family protein [Komagataeibacter oboediens]GCE80463.1 hypothetical protein MSKU3_1938 [Komagataeibacter oboediens]GCE88982.1 hypothetical protein MSKU15_0583 [Komagataeibacter diospyri]